MANASSSTPFAVSMRTFAGTPASRGVHRGTAVVQTTVQTVAVDRCDLTRGAVLVLRGCQGPKLATLYAAGAILASAGVLSSLAILAREIGVPMVSVTADVLDSIRDGDVITVNGDTGTLTFD